MEKFLLKPSLSSIQPSYNGLRDIISELVPNVHSGEEPHAHTSIFCWSADIFPHQLPSSERNPNPPASSARRTSQCPPDDSNNHINISPADGIPSQSP